MNETPLGETIYHGDPDTFIDRARKIADFNFREGLDCQAARMRADGVPEDAIEAARALSLAGWPADRERGLAEIRAGLAECAPGDVIDIVRSTV
jgi:hypothetical protein